VHRDLSLIPKHATLMQKFTRGRRAGRGGISRVPYWYACWRESGKLVWRYIGKKLPDEFRRQKGWPAAELPLFNDPAQPAEAQPDQADLVDEGLEREQGRLIDAWMILGYLPSVAKPGRETLRKKVWNLVQRKKLTPDQKDEIVWAFRQIDRAQFRQLKS
jgi:hypothetical protein